MSVAWLFPGQGMETPGMGLAMAERHMCARRLLAAAGEQIGRDPWRLLERGGKALERTEDLQPLLVAVCLGVAAALREQAPQPAYVAGHSLGEIAAWAAAGGLPSETAVALARTRGLAMGEAAERHPGGMLALLQDAESARAAFQLGQQVGVVDLAAHNAPEEWVLSGEHPALNAVARAFPARRLAVAGPWHGRLMAEAVAALETALLQLCPAPLDAGLIANRTGEPVTDAEIPGHLAAQLLHPVSWARTLRTLVALGVTHFVTVGPGRVLRGLARKNLGPAFPVYTTEDPADLARTAAILTAREATP